jgi:hypothetical protein
MPKRWKKFKINPNGVWEIQRAKPRLILEKICEFFTGHEISKTELGYSGRGVIDRNCRWCDKFIQVPASENIVPEGFRSLMNIMDEKSFLVE